MSFCTECGSQMPSDAKFCSNCGMSTQAGQQQPGPLSQTGGQEWLTLDEIINARDRRLGAIGALLAFFGSFCPWASHSTTFFGYTTGSYGVTSPFAWLVALAAIGAAIFLFRLGSGSIVMVVGIVVGALALLSILMAMSGQGSPSWGVLLTLAGGGLMAYSGHLMRAQ
jgi:hypothetical protein